MYPVFDKVTKPFKKLASAGREQFDQWFLQDTHRFTITGLSRSGKSMLFTSLMTILKHRSEGQYNCLPLLTRLPMELVEHMRLEPIDGYTLFPLEEHLSELDNRRWPQPTEQVYGFKLIVRLKQIARVKQWLLPYTDVVFEFIDYPGEWVTDLPMLNKTYSQWSDSTWAQQASEPQSHFAGGWQQFVREFDFESSPTSEKVQQLLDAYLRYLHEAKQQGISMLQPGSFLLDSDGYDWRKAGFTPLPAKITSDVSHPWNQLFSQHFLQFQSQWLNPLKQSTFKEADKQIILIDLFEGLNHSKQHLYQLKETLSHLAETFVYGNPNWFSRHVLNKSQIGKVAFVATKMDLAPAAQHDNMLSLLKDISAGAVAKFADKPIKFEHFLVSAIQTTDADSEADSLRFLNANREYVEASFEPIPDAIKAMPADEHFPLLNAQVPDDYLPRILNGRGLDRLLQFLLE
ncbi:YcjX family protein [Aestuariibacter salexigens]|uniref:YcjX family protein n=1 Tax=Aestuariibacter salexigens TaxID=226010 RepID=UPI0004114A48|nr:YcjX family protein [Aestuariibacter salexigens]